LQEDINELNRIFELFNKPFGIIIYGEIIPILEKRILERSEDITHYMSSSRKSIYASPRYGSKSGFAQKMENVFRGTFSKQKFNQFRNCKYRMAYNYPNYDVLCFNIVMFNTDREI
jgi:hypothetical protein